MTITFETDNSLLATVFMDALVKLRANIQLLNQYEQPVLIEGAEYQGVWLESAPFEGLVYSAIDPQLAVENHQVFFRLQRDDGYLPCWVWNNKRGTGQIQMVVPIAATALELYEQIGSQDFLQEAYEACVRWDRWLATYRDTRGTGLCEAFCEFDTGHDQSPRFHGLPQECPDSDARICPSVGNLPYLAPDLSATVYGGRIALARIATHLGRVEEAATWSSAAEQTRHALLAYCFDPEDGCFYDLDKRNHFVRIRGDALTRVLGEGIINQGLFEDVYSRQIKKPNAFWTPYPLPSIAGDDPAFVRDIPANSWGGATQGLTALRAPRWFERYGKYADLNHLMRQWIVALMRAHANGMNWLQQMNPWTGEFTPATHGYSPSMLVMLDFVSRLYSVRRVGKKLIWGCHTIPDTRYYQFTFRDQRGEFQIRQDNQTFVLVRNEKPVLRVQGECRVVTDLIGIPQRIIGTTRNIVTLSTEQTILGEWETDLNQIIVL